MRSLGTRMVFFYLLIGPLIFKIGFWVECGYRVMDAGGKFGERGGSIRGGRGAAKRNLSFLSAL